MSDPEKGPLTAEERPSDGTAKAEPLIVAVLAKWLLFTLSGLVIVVAAAWPFRIELLNRFGPGLASAQLGLDIGFIATRADFDRIELSDVAVQNGPSARTIIVSFTANPFSTPFLQKVTVDGLRMHVTVDGTGIVVEGLDLLPPTATEDTGPVDVPVRRFVLTDFVLEVDSPVGRNSLSGEVDLSLPSAPRLFPLKGRLRLDDSVSRSAVLAEFDSSNDSFSARGTGDLSLAHWLPLSPGIESARGRATARFDFSMLGRPSDAGRQVGGQVELAWTGAGLKPTGYPELSLEDGLIEVASDGATHRVTLPQPIEIAASSLPEFLVEQIPDTFRPYLSGAPQFVLDARTDDPALVFGTTDTESRLDLDMSASLTIGPLAAEIEPASLTLAPDFSPKTVFIRRSSLSVLRGVDLPRDLSAHLELGALELDLAAYLRGAFPPIRLSYALEGTMTGTVFDPVWVRQATFRGEGVADLDEGLGGIGITVEPGGQVRADGLTGTGDARLSPDLRVDVAGRDPLSVRIGFDDPAGSLEAKGSLRIGELSVALPGRDGTKSLRFGRQPASIEYSGGALGIVLGPSDIASPSLDAAALGSVIRATWRGRTGTFSFNSEQLMTGGRPIAPGRAAIDLAVSMTKDGRLSAEGPISLADGAISANLGVAQTEQAPVQTRISLSTQPITFGSGGIDLVNFVPPRFLVDANALPALSGKVSASLEAVLSDTDVSGTLALDLADLAVKSSEGAVQGLNGPLTFDLASFPATLGTHAFTASASLPGMPTVPVSARFRVDRNARIDIDEATLTLFGGSIALIDAVADAANGSLEGTVRLRRVSLADAMTMIDIEGVEATGQVSGLLPIQLRSGDAVIQGGSIGAEGGGVLKVDNPSVNRALASDEETVQLMTEVLKDFHYDSLTAEVDLPEDRDGTILLSMGGRNPAVLEGHPFQLNISLESDFRKLFRVLQQVLNLSTDILGRRSRD